MSENTEQNKTIGICSYLKVIGSICYSCFPICRTRPIVMDPQDKHLNMEDEWKDLYNRLDKLENNGVTYKNPAHHKTKTQDEKTYVTDEVRELFTRINHIERRLNEVLNIHKLDAPIKKKKGGVSWCTDDIDSSQIDKVNANENHISHDVNDVNDVNDSIKLSNHEKELEADVNSSTGSDISDISSSIVEIDMDDFNDEHDNTSNISDISDISETSETGETSGVNETTKTTNSYVKTIKVVI